MLWYFLEWSILSSARARTNIILAGKSDSRRHSTTSFSENVLVAKTSLYQMLGILPFSHREKALPPSKEMSVLTFVMKKSTMKLSGVSIFREQARKLKIKCRPRGHLVLEFKAL